MLITVEQSSLVYYFSNELINCLVYKMMMSLYYSFFSDQK